MTIRFAGPFAAVCVGLMFVMCAGNVNAEVYVTVDRTTVQTNESFTMVLNADNGEQGEPEVDGLSQHFDVLGRSQSSSISLVNGARTSSRRWTYVLLPKGPGTFTIPPLRVGNGASEPVDIRVTAAVVEAPGEADVFFEVSLDREQSWVQAQVIYTIKLYLGVATRQTSLAEPNISGGEVLVEQLPEDKRYEAQVGSRLYTVVERRYALFPQVSGEFEIAPARFTASLWERGRISSPRVFSSEPLSLSVAPTVAPPPAYADAAWLPAKQLTLQATLRPDDGILEPGEPANIRLQIVARGLLPEQLPEQTFDVADGLRVYPDQPDLQQRTVDDTIESVRQQGFAIIASRGGVFELPELALPWFNTDTGAWEVAMDSLPEIRAAGVVSAAPVEAVSDALPDTLPDQAESADTVALPVSAKAQIFRLKLINYGLLALWLLTVWVMWRSQRVRHTQRRRARKSHDAEAPFRSAQKAFRQVHRACDKNDPGAARSALLDWARAYWPDQPTRTLGDIARRLPAAECEPIEALNRHFYAAEPSPWRGKSLHEALIRINRPGMEARLSDPSLLPPLLAENTRR